MALNRRRVEAPRVNLPLAPHKRKRVSDDSDADQNSALPVIQAFKRKYGNGRQEKKTKIIEKEEEENVGQIDENAPTPVTRVDQSAMSPDSSSSTSALTSISDTSGSLLIVEDSPDLKCHEEIVDDDSETYNEKIDHANDWITVAKQSSLTPSRLITPARKSRKSKRRSAVDDGPISRESNDKSVVTRRASSLRKIKQSTWNELPSITSPTLSTISLSSCSSSLSLTSSLSSSWSLAEVSSSNIYSATSSSLIESYLSEDLFCSVLSYCSVMEILHCRSVNRSFHTASLTKCAWKYSHLIVEDEKELQKISNSSNAPNIKKSLKFLQILTINGQQSCELNDSLLLNILQSVNSLSSFSLLNCPNITDDCCQSIANLLSSSLKSLTLQNCLSLTDRGLSLLQPISENILSLDLTKYRGLTTLKYLRTFKNLTELNLRGCRGIDENSFGFINSLPLISLDLSFVPINRAALESIFSESPHSVLLRDTLQSLKIIGSDSVDNLTVYQIAQCRALISLDLSSCDSITDAAFTQWPLYGRAALTLKSLTLDLCRRVTGLTLRAIGETASHHQHQNNNNKHGSINNPVDAINLLSGIGGNGFDDEIHFDDGDENVDEENEIVDSDDELLHRESSTIIQQSPEINNNNFLAVIPHPWHRLSFLSVRHCHRIDSAAKSSLGRIRPKLNIRG